MLKIPVIVIDNIRNIDNLNKILNKLNMQYFELIDYYKYDLIKK